MRTRGILLLCVFLLIGCGGNKPEKKFEGVKTERNFMKEGFDYLRKTDIPKAIQSFDRAIQQDPTNAQNYIIVGQVYLKLNNYIQASDSFSAAIRVDPSNAVAYYLLGQCQALRGQTREAVETLQKSMLLYKSQNDEESLMKVAAFLQNLLQNGKEATQ